MNWAYIAGFFEGEGCVHLASSGVHGCSPRLDIAQSGEIGRQQLSRIQSFLKFYGIDLALRCEVPRNLSKLPVWKLTGTSKATVTTFLRHVMPYLFVKKNEAEDILRHFVLFPGLPKGGKLSWEGRKRKAAGAGSQSYT